MLENLRNQERLSSEEEDRIDKIIRILILVMMGVMVAVMIWVVVKKKPLGVWYYATILSMLAIVWIVKCVVGGILKRSLAQRTDEEAGAYLKAAGLELVAYAGLGWFLVGLEGNGIFGAVAYVIGMTGARKQRETYYGITSDSEKSSQEAGSGEEDKRGEDASADSPAAPSLPSAADRQEREKEMEE